MTSAVVALGIAATVVALLLILVGRFRLLDVLSLVVMGTVSVFLGRLSIDLTVIVGQRPFKGLTQFFLLWFLVLLVLRLILRGGRPLGLSRIVACVLGFAGLALLSALVNGGSAKAIVAAIHVLCYVLLPLGVAFLVVGLLPQDRRAVENLITAFLLINGVVVPAVMLVNAISRGLFTELMGWEAEEVGEYGITHATTFLGGRIASGLVVTLAYGLAMMRFVGKKQTLAIVPLALAAFAMLFSLSRTMIILMGVFHVVFFWKSFSRSLGRIAILLVLATIGILVSFRALTTRYSFERFLMTEDASTQMRLSGIRAAWVASAKAPVLGHGPGLLYEQFRTYFQVARGEQKGQQTVIEGYLSPMEPHNTYAFLAAEHGYPALLLFIGIMVICWRRTQIPGWHRLDIADQTYRTGFQALWLAWFAGMWVHSSPLVHLKVSLMFWLFAGIGLLWRACLENERAAGVRLAVPSAPPLRAPLPAYAVGTAGMSTPPSPGRSAQPLSPGDSGPERSRTGE